MEKEEQKWEQIIGMEEQEQEEEESDLVVRKSRNGNEMQSNEIFAAAVDDDDGDVSSYTNGVSKSNGHPINGAKIEDLLINAENEQTKMKELYGVLEDEPAAEEEDEVINEEQKKENLVFFEKSEGVDSTDFGEYQAVKKPEPENPDIPSLDFLLPNNPTTAINDKYEDGLLNKTFSSPNYQPSQVTLSNEIESAEVDLLNDAENDLEAAEFDVERVIKQQNTHDLFCPNCNSCITRRVILRKRKRVPVTNEEAKRNKTKIVVEPVLDAGSVQSHGTRIDDNDAQIPTVDEDERERGPDIFRCLSCFSFFIPTGNGFKLFGEKNGREKIEDERAPPSVKKNWFASMFASNSKPETNVLQGSSFQTDVRKSEVHVVSSSNVGDQSGQTDVRKSEVHVVSSSNIGDQSGQTSFLQISPSPGRDSEGLLAAAGNSDTLERGDNILHFPKQKPSLNGTGYKFNTTRTETVDTTTEKFDSYTGDQSKESKFSKEVHVTHENNSSTTLSTRTQVVNGASNEDNDSISQQDGLKLLISSNNGFLTLENSMDGQIINQTMQSADQNDVIPLSTPVSELEATDVDGELHISASIPREDQDVRTTVLTESVHDSKKTNFSNESGHVHSTETSKHTVTTTKYEVHSGKDTVINIDSHPNELSQTVQDITGQTETSSLLHPSTQTNIAGRERTEERQEYKIEVIKSIVYGGLAESITSLSVVSSAVGGGAATLNILALGMANLIGGLFIICHNLWELRCDRVEQVNTQISDQVTNQRDRYKELLGRRQNFVLHAIVTIISYLVFGLVPPVVYGFSFRKTDDKQLKLVVVAASSLLCIAVLAIGRAYVCRPPKPYLKTIFTFIVLGFMVSGVSYAAGELVERLLEKLGLFQTSSVSGLGLNEINLTGKGSAWASY
ncbi:hypothetical protein CASFOL_023759 [Castilleja foliolosa]|uniref:Membrane protein of ER body-like protein n=1 Tax=Castilleja foliolosa TaxID=1961234 RepID=A0ABD3CPX3_9LAMI